MTAEKKIDIDVSIAKDGRILILTEDGFAASYKNGVWIDKMLFDIYEQRNDFSLPPSRKKAEAIYIWAKIALKKRAK